MGLPHHKQAGVKVIGNPCILGHAEPRVQPPPYEWGLGGRRELVTSWLHLPEFSLCNSEPEEISGGLPLCEILYPLTMSWGEKEPCLPGNEEEKLKFYITSWSFCLCNSAYSLQSLDHVGLRKWGLTIQGIGVYLTHSCTALCNPPAPANPQTHLIMPVRV